LVYALHIHKLSGVKKLSMVGHTYQTANVQNSPHQNVAPSKYRPI
jgi:hypothetical protein